MLGPTSKMLAMVMSKMLAMVMSKMLAMVIWLRQLPFRR